MSLKRRIIMGGLLGLLWACQSPVDVPSDPEYFALNVPDHFSQPVIPADNALTQSRVRLGRMLFYEPLMSRDSSRSCSSCHLQEFAFADTARFSRGVEDRLGFRNSPSLSNVAWQERLLREGGVPTLEGQVLVPIQDHAEFDFNILLVAERLARDSQYVALSRQAYGREPDAFVISRSLAAFERTLIGGDSPYDHYITGKNNALSRAAKRGLALFESERTRCSSCHSGILLTDQHYRSNGLYEQYPDSGRARLTRLPEDRGLFKVASLRNVALTAPYMHDGSLPDLQAVLDHYMSGGAAHPNKDPLLRPFTLTPQEQADLIAFLHSLTEPQILLNPDLAAPR